MALDKRVHKITINGETIHPATTTDAVVHPTLLKSVTDLVWEYNISDLLPESGIDSTNIYNISLAAGVLDTYLPDNRKVAGTSIGFLSDTPDNPFLRYEFMGGGLFSDPTRWYLLSQQESGGLVRVDITVDDGTGVPSATGKILGDKLILDFKNLKGATGVNLGDVELVQELGKEAGSEGKVMSQKAVTEAFENYKGGIPTVSDGTLIFGEQ